MGTADSFCLRWNDFESNISSSFRDLRQSEELFDVTLCCNDGTDFIKAHKVILAACSPFFRRILAHNTHQHPFLYLKGIQKKDLLLTLSFMYDGLVTVAQDDLNNFLSVAEELAIKGLTTNETSGAEGRANSSTPKRLPPLAKRRHISPSTSGSITSKRKVSQGVSKEVEESEVADVKRIKAEMDSNNLNHDFDASRVKDSGDDDLSFNQFNDELYDSASFGTSTAVGASVAGSDTKEDFTNIEAFVNRHPNNGAFFCEACGYESLFRRDLCRHVEALHCSMIFTCTECSKEFGFCKLDELEAKVQVASTGESNVYRCTDCEYSHRKRAQILSHIESFHVSNSYSCEFCQHVCPTLGALKKHIYRNHRNVALAKSMAAAREKPVEAVDHVTIDFMPAPNFDLSE